MIQYQNGADCECHITPDLKVVEGLRHLKGANGAKKSAPNGADNATAKKPEGRPNKMVIMQTHVTNKVNGVPLPFSSRGNSAKKAPMITAIVQVN